MLDMSIPVWNPALIQYSHFLIFLRSIHYLCKPFANVV